MEAAFGFGVGDLPGPVLLVALGLSALLEGVPLPVGLHQGDFALVHLGLGVHDLKNALGAGHGGQDGGHLHGNLVDGLGDLLGVGQEGHQSAHVEAAENAEHTAHHGGDGVAHVGELGAQGHQHHGIGGGLGGGGAVVLVELVELDPGGVLVGEGLDHLQTLDILLDGAVDGTQGGLLQAVELAAQTAQLLEQYQDDEQDHQGDDEQQGGQHQHHDHGADEGDGAGQQLDHALLQGQLDVVGVVGEPAHELAVGVLVKVAQGELLEFVKQIFAHGVAALLGQLGHQVGLQVGAGGHDHIDQHHQQDAGHQPREDVLTALHRVGEAVDDGPQGVGARHAGQAGQHNADQGGHQPDGPDGQIPEGAQHRGLQVFGLAVASPHVAGATGLGLGVDLCLFFCHYCSTPSC